MQNTQTRFGAANRGTKACDFCGVLSWASRQDDTANQAMCTGCYDSAGYENEHQDGFHADRLETRCPVCNPQGEAARLAKAAVRVAAYTASAAAKSAKAAEKEATYPHCPNCQDRRPKTKTWERTGVAGLCSTCKDLADWVTFHTVELNQPAEAAKYQASFNARTGRYAR
jgi:hypothetical protein